MMNRSFSGRCDLNRVFQLLLSSRKRDYIPTAWHRTMSQLAERIFDNINWVLGFIIIATIAVFVGIIWELLQESPSPRDIFDTVGVFVALLGLCFSQYQSNRRYNQAEERIDELRKKRLQPEYKERSRIIDEAIETAQENISRLSGDEFAGDLDRVLELESLAANHQEYFEENHPDFVGNLNEYKRYENKLNRLQSNVRAKLEDSREVEMFVDDHSELDSDPTSWMIEQIVTFSDVTWNDIEERFGIVKNRGKIPVQNSISNTQKGNGSGMFFHEPQPEWMQEYVEAKDETIQYFNCQIETLKEIKRDQTV